MELSQEEKAVFGVVNMYVKKLTLGEVAALSLGLAFDNFGPHLIGYEKLKGLCTGGDGQMHGVTKQALEHALQRRVEEGL